MSLALLFPGQGVQHPDMLRWLDRHPLAEPTLALMAAEIGADWRARLHDPEWATGNRVAQCLLTGVALAAWQALAPQLPEPVAVAGYSVGELAACSAVGVYGAPDALHLARRRAEVMDDSAAGVDSGLVSASGVPEAVVAALCARLDLAVAIRLGPERWVLGGLSCALARAATELAGLGADLVPLRVQVASHTPLMRVAADAFAQLIEPMPWRASRALVVTNLDGEGQRQPLALKRALARQIASTVQWHRCLETLAERMPRCVLEVGPGCTLSRMWAAGHADVPVRSVDEFHSAEAVVAWVRKTLDR
ncbi:ACP S-malonyltransferase [Methylibium sp.]|uniref:ACP S-malonyltransferase n=1 Tax=Methylibium sp. TaxID=2067992 RepID=UPI003D106CD5